MTPNHEEWYMSMRRKVSGMVGSVLDSWRYDLVHWVYRSGDVSVWVHGFEDAFKRNPKTKNSILGPVVSWLWTPPVALYAWLKLIQDSEISGLVDFTHDLAFIILWSDEFVWETDDLLRSKGIRDYSQISSIDGKIVSCNLSDVRGWLPAFFDDMRYELLELKRNANSWNEQMSDFEKFM